MARPLAAAALLCLVSSQAQQPPAPVDPTNLRISRSTDKTGTAFERIAPNAIAAMKARAEELKIEGAAVIAYAEGRTVTSWSSRMAIVGKLKNPPNEKNAGDNLLAIAYSKAAEMADTLQNSGSGVRPPLKGEFGWQGGLIKETKTGWLIAAFSGGKSEDDLKVARAGLDAIGEAL